MICKSRIIFTCCEIEEFLKKETARSREGFAIKIYIIITLYIHQVHHESLLEWEGVTSATSRAGTPWVGICHGSNNLFTDKTKEYSRIGITHLSVGIVMSEIQTKLLCRMVFICLLVQLSRRPHDFLLRMHRNSHHWKPSFFSTVSDRILFRLRECV